MERPRFGLLGSVAMAIASTFGSFAGERAAASAQAIAPRRPTGKRAATPRPRHGSMQEATDYLGKRTLQPDRASNLRKLQRAFRLAGRSFTPGRG